MHVEWPKWLVGTGNLFRSSGRFTWPLVYVAMVAICWLVARGSPRRVGSVLLIAGALVQAADSSAGWRAYGETLALRGQSWPTGLVSPFWKCAGQRYRAVRLVVPRNRLPAYRDLGAWALAHGMTTDVVYLARSDPAVSRRWAGAGPPNSAPAGWHATRCGLPTAFPPTAGPHAASGDGSDRRGRWRSPVRTGLRDVSRCPMS